MANLFKKAAVFTDIHFGKKSNSREFNQDCENFITWFIDEAKAFGAETFIFTGDWHDSRRFLNVSTLNYTLSNLERLSNSFEKIWFIPGNHDLYYREKREINSVEFGRNLPNIEIINEIKVVDDVAFFPWLVGEEWEKVKDIKSRYAFGHFELPGFMMNAAVEMPDHGELRADMFKNQEFVFSGHFHKRQRKNNVWYIGNAFPHNYGDAWDDERGAMFLEWGQQPEFKTWPGQPVFRTLKLSQIIDEPEKYLSANTNARIVTDVDITYEEAQYLKETFQDLFKCRELAFTAAPNEEDEMSFSDGVVFQSIDQIVIEGLSSLENVESTSIDHKVLIDIYNSLDLDNG